jgi:hypothetical protein
VESPSGKRAKTLRVLLWILAVSSLGFYAPVLVAHLRRAKSRRPIAFLNVLCTVGVAISPYYWLTWAAVLIWSVVSARTLGAPSRLLGGRKPAIPPQEGPPDQAKHEIQEPQGAESNQALEGASVDADQQSPAFVEQVETRTAINLDSSDEDEELFLVDPPALSDHLDAESDQRLGTEQDLGPNPDTLSEDMYVDEGDFAPPTFDEADGVIDPDRIRIYDWLNRRSEGLDPDEPYDAGPFASAALPGKYKWSAFFKVRRLKTALDYTDAQIEQISRSRDAFHRVREHVALETLESSDEQLVVQFSGCYLIEVRKGARVTERHSSSSSSGRSFGGVRVGPAFVGGSGGSSSSSYSRSVSYPAPDVLQIIDSGYFSFTTRRASFVGGMFTKTVEFRKLAGYRGQGDRLLFAPMTGGKVWIVEFPSVAHQWLVSCLLDATEDSKLRRLEPAKDDLQPPRAWFESAIRAKRAEIDLAEAEAQEERANLRRDLIALARDPF